MLILQGTLRAATTLGGGTNKKTGEVIPLRNVLQVETLDGRGLVAMTTITVPELGKYPEKIGSTINLPVRAWAPGGAQVGFVYEAQGRQRDARSGVRQGHGAGARGRPLNLIHTNNSPNPVSMRLSGRLTMKTSPLETSLFGWISCPARSVNCC